MNFYITKHIPHIKVFSITFYRHFTENRFDTNKQSLVLILTFFYSEYSLANIEEHFDLKLNY